MSNIELIAFPGNSFRLVFADKGITINLEIKDLLDLAAVMAFEGLVHENKHLSQLIAANAI
jgi:hypothetical protein